MDPLFEQRLRDEVIYLHSLWHQGPPRAAVAVRHHLRASQPTQFKKQKRKNWKSAGSGKEWPCPPASPPTTGWPSFKPKTYPPLSAEEEWKRGGIHAQKEALKVVHEFFTSSNAGDSDAVDSSSDEDDELMERDNYSFFSKVFEEDAKLREYYDKSFANGEFSCLVCGALGGKKTLKKFKGCLPLVQHSITFYSKKRRAHRAFGQAVCKVLGWDLDHLPAIVSMLSDKLGENSATGADAVKSLEDRASDKLTIGHCNGAYKGNSSMGLVNNNLHSGNNDTLEGKNDEAVPESGYMGSGISLHGHEGDMNSTMCPNAGKNLEDCVVHTCPEEEWKLAGIHAQKKAIKVVHEFFTSSNSDDSDAIGSSSDDDDELMEKDNERDACSFFDKVFEEDAKLREYYEKSFANGEFSCLVCGALGRKKTFKKFKSCLPLVQHSITIYSKKRRAHRAFGQAVCKVLGWDLDHLSAIVSMLSDKLGEEPGKCNNDTLAGKNDEASLGSGCMGSGLSPHNDEGDTISASRADAVKNLEDSASDGLTIGNSSGAIRESSRNNDTLKGKIDEAVPESGCMGSGISLHGDEGDMNSVTFADGGGNKENVSMGHEHEVEEPGNKVRCE